MCPDPQPIDTADLQKQALELGLDALGVCHATAYAGTERHIAERGAAGLFADLKFTMARPESSCHPERHLDGAARSVVSAALCYWRPDAAPVAGDTRGVLARYTRWDAYAALQERLDALAGRLRTHGAEAEVLVDSNHHVDREAAVRSGVGFYGRNTNVITRRHGSWVVLGTIVTSADLRTTEPLRPGCGSCTLCIDACPTDAIVAPGVLDAGSCITYWTQSRHSIPEPVRDAMDTMVYGCDICQQVCPWNRGVEARSASLHPVDGTVSLVEWLQSDGHELVDRYRRFFIPRREARFLRRNALVAMGNAGREEDVPVVAAFLGEGDALLQEHARWALERIGGELARAALESHPGPEDTPAAS